jgi:hypothetical protein
MPRGRKPEPAEPEEEPRYVNGLLVVADEPVPSNLPTTGEPKYYVGRRLLTLEDNTQVYECAERDFVGTEGEIAIHRSKAHGAGRPGRRKQTAPEEVIPSEIRRMTIGELVHLARGIGDWENLFELKVAEAEGWKERALAAEAELHALQRLLGRAGYAKVEEE